MKNVEYIIAFMQYISLHMPRANDADLLFKAVRNELN